MIADADLWQQLWSISGLLFAIAAVGEVLAIVFVYRVLVRGGSAASTLLWMAVILLAPWLGLLLYYLLPRRLQLRRLRRMQARGRQLDNLEKAAEGAAVEAPAHGLEALLQQHGGVFPGNELEWLPSGEGFFRAAKAAIDEARHHVHCVVYILRPDETGLRFLAALEGAARRGVHVRLCYDSIGSFGLKGGHLAGLRAAGGEAEAFLPLFWKRRPFTVNLRNHRKLLVVDGEVGFVGGRNVGNEYLLDRLGEKQRWFDAMLCVRGPAVDRLQEVFVQDWCTATDEVLADVHRAGAELPAGVRVGVVCSGPDQDQYPLWFAFVQAIAEAKRSVELSSPYLLVPPDLLFALELAAARGVRVRVHTNGQAASAAILYHAQRHNYRKLLDAGIDVYETRQQYNHAKFLVVDESSVFVGSANMDQRSAQLNFEIAAVALDATELATNVMATIEKRHGEFRQVTHDVLPRQPLRRAVDALCGLFSPLL